MREVARGERDPRRRRPVRETRTSETQQPPLRGRKDVGDQHGDHPARQPAEAEPGEQTRHRPAASERHEDGGGLGKQSRRDLLRQLEAGVQEAERAEPRRATGGNHRGGIAAQPSAGEQHEPLAHGAGRARCEMQLCAERMQRAQTVLDVRGDGLRHEHQRRREAGSAGRDRGRDAVVRPDAAEGEHPPPATGHRRAQQQLELARLVAAVEDAGAIVALDPRGRDARRPSESLERFHRGGQRGQRQARDVAQMRQPAGERLERRDRLEGQGRGRARVQAGPLSLADARRSIQPPSPRRATYRDVPSWRTACRDRCRDRDTRVRDARAQRASSSLSTAYYLRRVFSRTSATRVLGERSPRAGRVEFS